MALTPHALVCQPYPMGVYLNLAYPSSLELKKSQDSPYFERDWSQLTNIASQSRRTGINGWIRLPLVNIISAHRETQCPDACL